MEKLRGGGEDGNGAVKKVNNTRRSNEGGKQSTRGDTNYEVIEKERNEDRRREHINDMVDVCEREKPIGVAIQGGFDRIEVKSMKKEKSTSFANVTTPYKCNRDNLNYSLVGGEETIRVFMNY
ncbi:hypothetical protein V8G54_021724 [Vigna mungo]|uniref:Uncharacterized protein n=1 Tax=Vigna mungo TaxID=3915 RepID=A0AAQ3NHW8_VIGMU